MPDDSKQPPGQLLQDLLERWRHQHRKRAEGGWWSLAGFSFQASAFLLRFFPQLEKGTTEPGQLAEMEQLSDILCPQDGRLTLIQVKRTLDKASLVAALEEAYLITDLCRRETPALLGRLRFQIACRRKDTPLNVADLSMSDVIKADGDTESWQAMLRQFDALNPIIEEPDTLDQLHLYLWNAGVQDTTLLIEQCAGRMLNSFDMPGPQAIRMLGRDLRSYFFAAPRRNNWIPIGRVLTLNHTTPDKQASKYTGVLTGQVPKFDHLRKGYLRERPQIFQSLWTAFTRWLPTLDSSESELIDKIPVFWISGRSGEGKSVLLLQLIAEFLKSVEATPTLQLQSGNDLPRLIETVPEPRQLSDPARSHIFAVIDDVYDLRDHEGWGDEIRNACSLRTPPLAIITCGPTEQREQFTSHLIGQFNVAYFEVPILGRDECFEFLAWYEARTGKSRDLNNLTTENVLLVQFIFELAQGMRLPEFAQRFKRRLLRLKFFEVARAILAVNALYMDAPLALIESDKDRDALARLCREDQLHFRITPAENGSAMEGVRLAHAHLAWLLFVEWVEPPTTLAKACARELAKAMLVMEREPASLAAGRLLSQLLTTTRLSDTADDNSLTPTANRSETIRELYRLHIRDHGGQPSLATATLPRWLDFAFKIPALNLDPDPAFYAVAGFSDDSRAHLIHGSAAAWVWIISERRFGEEAKQLRDAAEEFLLRYPNNPGIRSSIARLYARSQNNEAAKRFATKWLVANPTHPEAYQTISPLVAANPANDEVMKLAIDWLDANSTHPRASQLIAPLVAANPANDEVMKRAIDWLDANPDHPNAYWLITPLVAANPANAAVARRAIDWLDANPDHPKAYWLIPPLVSANPANATVLKKAIDWLDAKPTHPQAFFLLPPLVKAGKADPKLIDIALNIIGPIKKGQRDYVLPALARALVHNLENAGRYLNGIYAEERKHLVCALIGKGMKPDPDVFTDFVYHGANDIAPDHWYNILKSAVLEQAESDNLNAIIARWLNENFRAPVYFEMLDAFTENYQRWVRIERLGSLRSEIEQDFDALRSER